MKKLIIFWSFLLFTITKTQAQITNNSNSRVNIVMYSNYIAPANGKSAKGRINDQGTIIPPGQNINLAQGTNSIDIYYSDDQPGIHADVNANYSYTIYPAANTWSLTQDVK